MIYKIKLGFVSFIRDARSSALERSLQKLGIQEIIKDDEMKIGTWTRLMRITVRMVLKL